MLPSWALKLLGVATPFAYAALTYFLFRFLDKKASGPAKSALSSWIASVQISTSRTAAVAIEIFDRIYSPQLLSWRAFALSLTYTTIITLLVVWHFYSAMFWLVTTVPASVNINWGQRLLCNYAADYLSLFLIRRWLILGARQPLTAALTGPIVGILVLLTFYVATDVLRFSIQTSTFHPIYFIQGAANWLRTILFGEGLGGSRTALLVPALLIHLWLPLYAIGVICAKGANYFFRASKWTQWFIKQGRHHPFEAVGLVASVVVFVISAVISFLLR